MKALSLTRPWTTLVLTGAKTVENRSWKTTHRGPLVIHGAQSWDHDAITLARRILGGDAERIIVRSHPSGYLGVVQLVDICSESANRPDVICDCGPWAFAGQHHWKVVAPAELPQTIPGPGQLGLWTPPDDVQHLAQAVLA